MNKGIKAALALGLCCVTAAGLFGCTKAAPEETTQPATVATQPAATTADTTVPESTTNTSTDTTAKPAETTTNYGKGYDVDGTVSEGNNYYFAVYKNKKKYASVKVNMQTGDAVETRTKDGATANFNVFV